jgi:hypothetical protein
MFAADYPFVHIEGRDLRDFFEAKKLNKPDRDSIASGNWDLLRSGIRR